MGSGIETANLGLVFYGGILEFIGSTHLRTINYSYPSHASFDE